MSKLTRVHPFRWPDDWNHYILLGIDHNTHTKTVARGLVSIKIYPLNVHIFFRKRSSPPKPDANWISFHAPSPSSVLLPMIFSLLRWNQFLEWLWLNLWINFVSPTGDKRRRRLQGIQWRWSLFSVGYWFVYAAVESYCLINEGADTK